MALINAVLAITFLFVFKLMTIDTLMPGPYLKKLRAEFDKHKDNYSEYTFVETDSFVYQFKTKIGDLSNTIQLSLPLAALFIQHQMFVRNDLQRPTLVISTVAQVALEPRLGSFELLTNRLFDIVKRLPQTNPLFKSLYYAYYDRTQDNLYLDISYTDDKNIMFLTRSDQMVFIVHDWLDKAADPQIARLKNAFLAKDNGLEVCVILVDWQRAAQHNINFLRFDAVFGQAVANTVLVGRELGLLMKRLIKLKKISADKMHVIGIGMGAQVAHFAGDWFKKLNADGREDGRVHYEGPKIGRITGLDPTGLEFADASYWTYSDKKWDILNKLDAEFVDVIHTSSFSSNPEKAAAQSFAGIASDQELGHVDFYPNQGTTIPNEFCSSFPEFYCYQNLAIRYFTESVIHANNPARLPEFKSCRVTYSDQLGDCINEYRFKSHCFGSMGYSSDLNYKKGSHYLKYLPALEEEEEEEEESRKRRKRTAIANNRTIRASNTKLLNAQIPVKPVETFSQFPFQVDVDYMRTFDIQAGDHKSCGLFRAYPGIAQRIYNGYRPYRYQFPWLVCIKNVMIIYKRELYTDEEGEIQVDEGLTPLPQNAEHNDDPEETYTGSKDEDLVYNRKKSFEWTSSYTASSCTGSVIDRNWVVTAAHCFGNIKNGVPIYLAIGGLSCYKPHVSRMVVVEKRAGKRDQTIFVHPNYIAQEENEIRAATEAKEDECNYDQYTGYARPITGFDIALIRLPIALDIPTDWTPTGLRVNTLCLNTVAYFDYFHFRSLYLAGYGLDDAKDLPESGFIKQVIIHRDIISPDFQNSKYIGDDNINGLDDASVILTQIGLEERYGQGGDSGGPNHWYIASRPAPTNAQISPSRAVLAATVVGGPDSIAGHRDLRDGRTVFYPNIATNIKFHLNWMKQTMRSISNRAPGPKSKIKVLKKPFRKVVVEAQDYELDLDQYPDTASPEYRWNDQREYRIDYAIGVL